MELSNRQYAKHRGVTENAIRKAIKEGRISQTANGKIDPVIADQQWDKNSDPAQVNRIKGNSDDQHSSTYQQSRAIREAYNARMAKLQFEKETGKLISSEQVRMDAFNAGRIVRDRLLNIPDRIIPQLIGKTDVKEMEKLLQSELIAALNELHKNYGTEQ